MELTNHEGSATSLVASLCKQVDDIEVDFFGLAVRFRLHIFHLAF